MELYLKSFFISYLTLVTATYYCHYHYKSECTSSNQTIKIKKCRTSPIARYNSMLIFEGEVTKRVNSVFLDLQLSHKPPNARNFNQIFSFKSIKLCEVLVNPLLHFSNFFVECKKKYPNICRECPVLPGVVAINYTESLAEGGCPNVTNKNMPSLKSGGWFPDGDYKTSIKVHSNEDPEGLKIFYFFKIKNGDTKSF